MESDHLNFYKEVYYKELERRNSLNTEIALQGTMLVAIISGLFFLLTNVKSEHRCFHLLFSGLIAIESVIGLIAAFFLMRSYFDFLQGGRTFSYLPAMKDVNAYYQLVDKTEFNNFLKDAFISACDTHIDHNDHKSRLLSRSSRWITYLIVGGAIITIVFTSNFLLGNPNLKSDDQHGNHKSERTDPTADGTARRTATGTARARKPDSAKATTPPGRRTRGQDTLHHKAAK